MKRNSGLSILVFLCAGILVSCTKAADPTTDVTTTSVQSSMTATINGASWTGIHFSGLNVGGTLQIEGAAANGSQFTLGIPATTKSGSFNAGGTNQYQATYQLGTTYDRLMTGSIKITSMANNVISGNFSGSFTNTTDSTTINVTNGAFTVNYQ